MRNALHIFVEVMLLPSAQPLLKKRGLFAPEGVKRVGIMGRA